MINPVKDLSTKASILGPYHKSSTIISVRATPLMPRFSYTKMQQKPRSQRTCTLCADNSLGDETHFILLCSEPSLVEARDRYFETMRDSFGGEWDWGDRENY